MPQVCARMLFSFIAVTDRTVTKSPAIGCGTTCGRFVPSPNSPKILTPPQHIVTRSSVIPHADPDPLDKCANVTPVAAGTGMFGELVLLPLPNVPSALLPQQYVCSSSVRPQVCQKPALMDLKRK